MLQFRRAVLAVGDQSRGSCGKWLSGTLRNWLRILITMALTRASACHRPVGDATSVWEGDVRHARLVLSLAALKAYCRERCSGPRQLQPRDFAAARRGARGFFFAQGPSRWLTRRPGPGSRCYCEELNLIILGIILLVIGFIAKVAIVWTIGIIVVVIGAILALLGMAGHAVGGRRHYF
jgi:Family of unknown function (DUF6131)